MEKIEGGGKEGRRMKGWREGEIEMEGRVRGMINRRESGKGKRKLRNTQGGRK